MGSGCYIRNVFLLSVVCITHADGWDGDRSSVHDSRHRLESFTLREKLAERLGFHVIALSFGCKLMTPYSSMRRDRHRLLSSYLGREGDHASLHATPRVSPYVPVALIPILSR